MDTSIIVAVGLALCSGAGGLAITKPLVYIDVGEAFGQLLMRLIIVVGLVYVGILVAQYLVYDAIDKSVASHVAVASEIEGVRRKILSSMGKINTSYGIAVAVGVVLTALNESLLFLAKKVLKHEGDSESGNLQPKKHTEVDALEDGASHEERGQLAATNQERPKP